MNDTGVRLLVSGSRGITDRDVVFAAIRCGMAELELTGNNLTLLSGGAVGVDRLAEEFARAWGWVIDQRKPAWRTYGKRAGILRNAALVDAATHVICIWDGQSPGTRHVMECAESSGKAMYIVTL
jgi:hypothetical protein